MWYVSPWFDVLHKVIWLPIIAHLLHWAYLRFDSEKYFAEFVFNMFVLWSCYWFMTKYCEMSIPQRCTTSFYDTALNPLPWWFWPVITMNNFSIFDRFFWKKTYFRMNVLDYPLLIVHLWTIAPMLKLHFADFLAWSPWSAPFQIQAYRSSLVWSISAKNRFLTEAWYLIHRDGQVTDSSLFELDHSYRFGQRHGSPSRKRGWIMTRIFHQKLSDCTRAPTKIDNLCSPRDNVAESCRS